MSIPGTFSSMFMNTGGGTVSFIGVGSRAVRSGNGNLTLPVHASTQSGDYLVCMYQWDQDSSASGPTGSTELAYRDEGDFEVRASGLFYTGSNPVITLNSGGDQLIGAALTFRGVNTTTQLDATNTEGNFSMRGIEPSEGSDGSNSVPNVTTTVPNCFVITMIGHDINTSSSSLFSDWVNADLEGFDELVEYSTTTGWDGGFAAAGGIKRTAGAVGNTTFISTAEKDAVRISFALRPQ